MKDITPLEFEEKQYERYYEKLREKIKTKLQKLEKKLGKKGIEIILLAPDLFVLLYRLTKDKRIDVRRKIILSMVLAYWILPSDILPEMLLGSLGYLDDILITLYTLDSLFADTDINILLENWPGDPEVIKNIHRFSLKVKDLLHLLGGNIEQKVIRFADLMLRSGKRE